MTQVAKEAEKILIGHLRILLRDAEKLFQGNPVRDFDVTLILVKRALAHYDKENGRCSS